MKNKHIILKDTIAGTVAIKKTGPLAWEIKQRVLKGADQDNGQNPTWIRIENSGRKAAIKFNVIWASASYMHYRFVGYQKIGDKYAALRGTTGLNNTVYKFEVPPGVSFFGSYPWHFNEDTDNFLQNITRRHSNCRVRVIGKSAQGREIKCLIIGREDRKKPNVVVTARMHAMETAGSFAVEAIAKYLLNDPEGKKLLNKYVFRLFPNVNPDGTAAGLKLTRIGPNKLYNMDIAQSSREPSIRALRGEILALKPACILDYHSYLDPMPMVIFFDKRVGAVLFDELIDGRKNLAYGKNDRLFMMYWRMQFPWFIIKEQCYRKFKSTVVVTELTWNINRLPAEAEEMGVQLFKATMKAHEKVRRKA